MSSLSSVSPPVTDRLVSVALSARHGVVAGYGVPQTPGISISRTIVTIETPFNISQPTGQPDYFVQVFILFSLLCRSPETLAHMQQL
jgi:hypothetical protein